MNIENLRGLVGTEVKNYEKMCEILKEPVKSGGRNQRLQQADWKRYFDFEKKGHKFHIVEIYDSPLDKQDGRTKGNNSSYINYITLLVEYSLRNTESRCLTLHKWWSVIKILPERYFGSIESIEKICGSTPYYINKFRTAVNKLIKTLFFRALDYMVKDGTAGYREVIWIILEDKSKREATKEEKAYIDYVEKTVLAELGFVNKMAVVYKRKENVLYEEINRRIQEDKGWRSIWKEWEIYRGINYDADKEIVIEDVRKELNDIIVKRLYQMFADEYEKNQKEVQDWHKERRELEMEVRIGKWEG